MNYLRSILFMTAIATSLFAQPSTIRHTELSLSGYYQDISFGSSSGSTSAFLVSPRVGFYVIEGLELEPEAMFMFVTGSDPTYVLNGNLTYNFISAAKAVPFLLAGYGISNTVPFLNTPSFRADFGINVLNLGAGMKIYLTEDVALRLEYRYQKYTGHGEERDGFYSYSESVDSRIHTLQFGLSVLL